MMSTEWNPLNTKDTPGYFLTTTIHAMDIIRTVNCKNPKLIFDCYHIQLMEGNIINVLKHLLQTSIIFNLLQFQIVEHQIAAKLISRGYFQI